MNAITFRASIPTDLEWLLELRLTTMSAYLEAAGERLSVEDQLARVRQDFEHIRIIRCADRDVGMLKLLQQHDHWEVVQIQLLPQDQGCGYGTMVLETILRDARDRGVPVVLSVLKVNPAQSLYRRLGFVVVEDRTRSLRMRRDP